MPRVKLYEVPFERVARLIKGYTTTREVADKLGMCYETARRRMEKPDTLTLRELRDLSIKLHIPKSEIMEAITW